MHPNSQILRVHQAGFYTLSYKQFASTTKHQYNAKHITNTEVLKSMDHRFIYIFWFGNSN